MIARDEIDQILGLHSRLAGEKQLREGYWQLLHDYTIPHKAAVSQPFAPGATPFRRKYDCSGTLAAMDFAANLYSELTPPGSRWFVLTAPAGSAAGEDASYGRSLAERTERLHLAMAQSDSNWETELYNAYEDLAAGTCCIAVRRHKSRPFGLSTRPLHEYTFLENDDHQPDTVLTERQWTAYQASRRFGVSVLPEELQGHLRRRDVEAYTTRRTYLNICRPRDLDAGGQRPYESLWIDVGEKQLLERSTSRRLRYIIARFWRPTGMTWGMGPSDAAYPSIRGLDKSLEIVLKYGAKKMDPASFWPDDGAFHPQVTTPGAIIRGRMGANDRGLPQYLQLEGDHRMTQFLFEYLAGTIARAYLADVFKVLRDTKQRTAREVVEILEKDSIRAVPIFARLKTELFDPLIRLCLELMTEYELGVLGWRYGGQTLPEYEYDLEMISPLALAVKVAELRKLGDLALLQKPLADVDPSVWDNYSLDDISRAIGENMGVPHKWLRSLSERRAMRERRTELLAQREALEQSAAAAGATEKLSKPVAPGSPLARMLTEVAA